MSISVTLAPLDSTDMGLVRKWRNDSRVWQWCRQNTLISDAQQVRWFNAQEADPTIKMFKIMLSNGEKAAPIGVCGLTSIDLLNCRAEFSLYVAPDAQGKGLGRAALTLLLKHGFYDFGLNVIWGESFAGNPALNMFKAIGFKTDGVRRDFYWRAGEYVDAVLVSITREEFDAEHNADRNIAGFGSESLPGGNDTDLPSSVAEVLEYRKPIQNSAPEPESEVQKVPEKKANS